MYPSYATALVHSTLEHFLCGVHVSINENFGSEPLMLCRRENEWGGVSQNNRSGNAIFNHAFYDATE